MRIMLLPIRVGLNGLLKVVSLPVSPSLGVRVGLKDFVRVMLLSSSILLGHKHTHFLIVVYIFGTIFYVWVCC